MNRPVSLLRFAALTLLGLLSACGSEGAACKADGDCKAGQSCVSGRCSEALKVEAPKKSATPVASTSATASTPSASGVPTASPTTEATAAPAESAAAAPGGGIAPMKVAEGWFGDARWVPEFTLRRDAGGEGANFLEAQQRCMNGGLDVCTESQFERACSLDREVGAVELWTATGEAGKVVTRGGTGCADRSAAGPFEASPARTFACCSRVIAFETENKDPAFLSISERRMIDLEKGLRTGTPALEGQLAPKVDFFGSKLNQDEVIVKIGKARGTAPWTIHDKCRLSADAAAGTWTADCSKITKLPTNVGVATTRYLWNQKDAVVTSMNDL